MPCIEDLVQDLRFALRQVAKNPAFACTVIVVLALGMGASVAIFAFVDAALLKPLPYRHPNRLVNVTESVAMIPRANLSYPDYLDWKSRNDVLSSLDVWDQRGYMLNTPDRRPTGAGRPSQRWILSHAGRNSVAGPRFLYRRRFAQRAPYRDAELCRMAEVVRRKQDVIGQAVTLSGDSYTIVAVLPRTFSSRQQIARSSGPRCMSKAPVTCGEAATA